MKNQTNDGTRCGCIGCWLCGFSRKVDSTGMQSVNQSYGFCDFLNRHDKRDAPLIRIRFRFHATLCSFSERVRWISTGSLQPLQYAIRRVELSKYTGKTAFPGIGGSVFSLALLQANSFILAVVETKSNYHSSKKAVSI